MVVIPAFIPESRDTLLESVSQFVDVVPEIQIDLVDGVYAGNPSWPWNVHAPFEEVYSLVHTLADSFSLEIDIMALAPEAFIEPLISARVQRLVIHAGSTDHLDDILALRNLHTKIGIALRNDMPLEILEDYYDAVDFVQCMGIAEVGVQGNEFDGRVISRIAEIKAQYPALEISVDGHVTMYTLPLLKQAGATRFAVGSAILKDTHPLEAFHKIQQLAQA